MRVKLVKLRESGRRLPRERITEAQALEGDLELVQYRTTSRGYSCALLMGRMPLGMPVRLAVIYEPRVLTIDGDVMMFDGLEKLDDGQLVAQQWKCLVVSQ